MKTTDEELTKVEIAVMQTIWAADEELMMGQIRERMNKKLPKPWRRRR